MQHSFIVAKLESGKRLDAYLKEKFADLSRAKLQTLIDKEKVLVSGIVKKSGYKIKENDQININLALEEDNLAEYKLDIPILYEDDDIIVVNKPAGLTVHPPNKEHQQSLVNALITMGKVLAKVVSLRPGIVHRLDKETSGVLIVAKNPNSYYNLIEQFKARKVKKQYRAIVWGRIEKDELVVDMPIKRDEKNRLRMKIGFAEGKNAYTQISVLKRFKDNSLLALRPTTGRMHQLRLHLKFLGYPIVGDDKYGKNDGFKQLFLHAYKIEFTQPVTNKPLEFIAPIPAWFKEFTDK